MQRAIGLGEVWLEHDRRVAIALLTFWLVPLVWFVTTDFRLYSSDEQRLYLRLLTRAVSIAIPLVGIVYVYRSGSRSDYSRTVFAVAAAAAILLLCLNLQRPLGMPLPIRTPLVFLILVYAGIHTRPFPQAVVPLSYSVGLAIQHFLWSPNLSASIGDLLVLAVVNAIGITLVRRRNRVEAELDEALERAVTARRDADEARQAAELARHEVRTLASVIPICVYCRKLRAERDDWQQLERYVLEKTGTQFSHGMCPTCARQHHPDVFAPGGTR